MTPVRGRAREVAAATPAHRDRYVDLLRATAIVTVVLGHWVVSAVAVDGGGRLGGVNLLGVLSWTHPFTWLVQVMPVVFLVGGFANTASWDAHRRRGGPPAAWVRSRALRLLRPAVPFLAVLVTGSVLARAVGADPQVVRDSVTAAAMSLWFLVVYLAVVALGPLLLGPVRRAGPVVLVPLVLVVGAGDVLRATTGSAALATGSYLLGWVVPHQLGVAWRDGLLTARRSTAWLLAGGGLAAALLGTTAGPYAVTMVGAGPAPDLTNTAPPTLALVALGCAQAGVVLLLQAPLERLLRRPGPWFAVVTINLHALTVYLWHMVPVVVAGALLVQTGLFPDPPLGSGAWWWLRVPWVLLLAVLLLVPVAATSRWERRVAPRSDPPAAAVAGGVVACVLGLAGLGVGGPEGTLPAVVGIPVLELLLVAGGITTLHRAGRALPEGGPAGGTPRPGRAAG